MSLNGKRLVSFFVFAGVGGLAGCFFFLVPLSILAWYSQESAGAGGAGFFIGALIIVTPIAIIPRVVVGGLLALPIINRALKANTRSQSDYAAFLAAIVLSAFIGIVATYITAWIIAYFARIYG